jgi:nucleoside-diphosphate kinase
MDFFYFCRHKLFIRRLNLSQALEMAGKRTFTMIKPDAVGAGNTGAILKMIEEAGFRIIALKKTQLSRERAGQFYAIHKDRPFFKDLIAYMSSGPIIPLILEKEDAVDAFRNLIGATDPQKAAPGTIRAVFAKSIEANAIHGSDSDENAAIECNFFFSELERHTK